MYEPRDMLIGTGSGFFLTNPATGQRDLRPDWHWVESAFYPAWDVTKGGGSVVAVIDSEFATDHPDLQAKLAGQPLNLDSKSSSYRSSNVKADAQGIFHGTHVAGIIGAQTDNGIGVAGACFDCTLLLYRVNTTGMPGTGASNLDQTFVENLTDALREVATSKARVVNMSLGTRRDHAPLRDAINFAASHGKVLVAASGNDQQKYPFSAHYPAAYDNVIAVASTRPNDQISPFSSQGDYVDIAAPGEPIMSTWSQDDQQPPPEGGDVAQNERYAATQGTSMASPMVAGLAALMLDVRPDLTPGEVEALMKQSARKLGSAQAFGAGRIDALAAVNAAKNYVRPAPPASAPVAPTPVVKRVPVVPAGPLLIARNGVVTVRVRCNGNALCRGRVILRSAKKVKIGKKKPALVSFGVGAYRVQPGKTAAVRIKVPPASRKFFTRKRVRANVRVIATPVKGEGVARTVTRPLIGSLLPNAKR